MCDYNQYGCYNTIERLQTLQISCYNLREQWSFPATPYHPKHERFIIECYTYVHNIVFNGVLTTCFGLLNVYGLPFLCSGDLYYRLSSQTLTLFWELWSSFNFGLDLKPVGFFNLQLTAWSYCSWPSETSDLLLKKEFLKCFQTSVFIPEDSTRIWYLGRLKGV